jgi:WD40 repeat protein
VTFSPDGKHIATGNINGTAYVFRLPTNFRHEVQNVIVKEKDLPATVAAKGFLLPEVGQVSCLACSPDGQYLVVGGQGGKVRMFIREGDTWHAQAPLAGHTKDVWAVAFGSDSRTLVTGGDDLGVRVWLRQGTGWVPGPVLTGNTLPVYGLAVLPNGRTLLSVGGQYSSDLSGEMKRWDIPSGGQQPIDWELRHTLAIRCMALSPDGKTLATAGPDKRVVLRDTMTGKVSAVVENLDTRVHSLTFGPQGDFLLTGDYGYVKQWKQKDGQLELMREMKTEGYILGIAIDPTGTLVATAGHNLQVFHLPTGDEIATLTGHLSRCDQVAFLPDGKTLFSISFDGSVRRWEVTKRQAGTPSFAILAREGKPERLTYTLSGAIAQACDGDIIEVRGNGPFEVSGVAVSGKALTIRGGPGSRPVFVDRPGAVGFMLHSRAKLTLEGLEFRVKRVPVQTAMSGVACEGEEFAALNCRFISQGGGHAIVVRDVKRALFRNCEIHADASSTLYWNPLRRGELLLENCTISGQVLLSFERKDMVLEDCRVRIRGTTMATTSAMEARLLVMPTIEKEGALVMELSDNVFANSHTWFLMNQWTELYKPAEFEKLARTLFRWKEENNVMGKSSLLAFTRAYQTIPETPVLKSREEWEDFWKLPKGSSLQGTVRFVEPFKYLQAVSLPPSAFRLHPESAGAKKGAGGRDLGVDVELLGPAAYERFRKSEAYRDWRK